VPTEILPHSSFRAWLPCHSERSEGSWCLLAAEIIMVQARTKIPRFARDDNLQEMQHRRWPLAKLLRELHDFTLRPSPVVARVASTFADERAVTTVRGFDIGNVGIGE
jgi:hypothetical protein